MQIAFCSGEIDYYEYSKYFRKKENLIIQFIMLFSFMVVMGLIFQIPVYVIIGGTLVMMYGFVLQSKAYTVKQQMLYSFIWAITSFVTIAIILIVAVEFFGFMQ